MSIKNPVKVLSAEVARKIAAGEVIDRPNAIIRELLDNAIDSGADSITVEVFDGGISKIRVTDNGSGMTREDLELAPVSHATSKITTEQDLLNLSTLGFRGEALSSIASVARLTISSGDYKLEADVSSKNKITEIQPVTGTVVESADLFANFPARRLFLKRPATEAKMCQNTFIEKALPFYNIDFRFYSDGELKINLSKTDSLQKRMTEALDYSAKKDLFYTIKNAASDESWSYVLVIGEPSIYRNDRKDIGIFVNNRKVNEYSLVQAIEYGVQGFFPNGTHPVANLFVTIDSNLVDFNIHPAKKEVRFKDISELHHSVSSSTQSFFKSCTLKSISPKLDSSYYENTFSNDFYSTPAEKNSTVSNHEPSYSGMSYGSSQKSSGLSSSSKDARSMFINSTPKSYASHLADLASRDEIPGLGNVDGISNDADIKRDGISQDAGSSKDTGTENSTDTIRYIGPALGVFLIVEKNDTLYLIDQHAAHERILYNNIISNPAKSQKLLIPFELETQTASDDEYLKSISDELEKAGFVLKNCSNGKWQITEVHERWTLSETDLQKMLLDEKVAPEKLLTHIAATTACKAAIKDGYYLDDETAAELCKKALSLEDPHCPHGRPIWTAITREKLFELVRRT
ncbi:MAG: DNA mismatch repair endonuclease MutL [Treponema sp.]|nr:DNA mismatch repair endonuclease MutL [Candidatus Treponema merdequi]